MKLEEWLAREGIKHPQFAPRIGRSAEAVRRYINGERIPDRETMIAIVRETVGEVTANDFFDIPVTDLVTGPALCSACDLRAEDPHVRSCTAVGCPLAAIDREAA